MFDNWMSVVLLLLPFICSTCWNLGHAPRTKESKMAASSAGSATTRPTTSTT